MSELLEQNIQFITGVGPKRAALLNNELGIFTYEDLLWYFPYKYIDRTKFYSIREIHPDLPYIQIKGKITNYFLEGPKNRQRLSATFSDGTGVIELIWFKGIRWITDTYKKGVDIIVFGKPSIFNGRITIAHPEIEEVTKFEKGFTANLQPFYNTTEKLKTNYLNSKAIHKILNTLFEQLNAKIPETLPDYIIKKHNLLSINDAIFNIHFPQSPELLKKAQYRLKLEELFYIQLNLLKQRNYRIQKFKGFNFEKIGYYFNTFYKNHLKFELTDAQKKVIREIRKDVGSGKQMNRLLQGDVGSGKTLVALMTMLMALDNGYQACLMAPTEILATQHFKTISNFLEGLPINIQLLTGSTKTRQRKIIHESLLTGELHILIGTHALIEDVVQFKNLGIVIIDEQHRFGVAQRAKLWSKNNNPPHILVMTATPIPRTLAMTLYGDLDVSVIDEMPPGRKPIKTYHFFESQRLKVYGFIRQQIEAGRQVYIVYPLINESEKMDYIALEQGYESISRSFPPPKYAVSIMHGKLDSKTKEYSMRLFTEGKTHIMVSTTVIEVGVDVPNASVMIIESAERFGLSQLHQLRGRVGRGHEQSHCILITSDNLSNDARKRIETMIRTTDGFQIAETDMKLRGPGDLEGTQQSGIPFDLKIADLAHDSQLLMYARDIATKILENDPLLDKPENTLLNKQLKKLTKNKFNWGLIS